MSGEALVGDLAGAQLNFNSASMVSMDSFGKAYPNGSVLSRDTGFTRSYGRNPYAGYDNISQNPFLFDGGLDERLLTMERVVAIALQDQSVAHPFSVLARNGVVHDTLAERNLVIFYLPGTGSALGSAFIAEGQDVGATGVFEPVVDNSFLFLDKATSLPIKKPAVAGTSLVRPRMDR